MAKKIDDGIVTYVEGKREYHVGGDTPKWYIFTFGSGQQHAGHYVKFFGTFETARSQMIEQYGLDWAMQYSEEKWNEWLRTKPEWIPAETELK